MNPIFAAAREIQGFCLSQHWRFCFIGGVAVQRWGEPRLTHDVDVTILSGFGEEEEYVGHLLEAFEPRIEDAADFALRNRVLLLHAENGIPLDVALGAMPFEERAVERASDFRIDEGLTLTTCSAEDLLVFKAFAGRSRDWADIESVVLRYGDRLDQQLVWRELLPLLELKDEPEIAKQLRDLLDGT